MLLHATSSEGFWSRLRTGQIWRDNRSAGPVWWVVPKALWYAQWGPKSEDCYWWWLLSLKFLRIIEIIETYWFNHGHRSLQSQKWFAATMFAFVIDLIETSSYLEIGQTRPPIWVMCTAGVSQACGIQGGEHVFPWHILASCFFSNPPSLSGNFVQPQPGDRAC